MSSVIVLDSSDEEEVPAKKAFIAPSIPATITPIKGNASANQTKIKKTKPRPIPSGITITRRSPVNVSSGGPTTSSSKTPSSGIFSISPIDDAKTATISAATLAATTKLNSLMAKTTSTNLIKVNSATTLSNAKERQTPTPPRHLLTQQTMQKVQQTQQIATTTNKQLQQKPMPQMQQLQQGLPLLSQLPQLQPSPSVLRKRLSNAASPTTHLQQQQQPQPPKLQKPKQQLNPPKLQQQQQQQQKKLPSLALDTQARKLNTPPATMIAIGTAGNISTTSTATLLPMISSVQSMAASATPPLQLLATPPHSAATTFSDQQLFSPKLMHTTCSLPPSTTVTAARTQVANSINANYNNNNNNNSNGNSNAAGNVGYINNNNNKNFNNNFKIMLPPKSSNNNSIAGVNPATSMTSTSPSTPTLATPVALQQANTGPRIAYVNSLATQISTVANKTNNGKNLGNFTSKSKTTSAPASIVPIAITAAAPAISSLAMTPPATPAATVATSASATTNPLLGVRRVKPTTLLRKNDEAWQKRATTPTTTTMTSAKKYNDDDLVLELLPHDSDNARTQSRSFTKTQQPAMPSLKTTEPKQGNKLANVYTKKPASNKPAYPLKIDLTASPEKTTPSRRVETITISPTTSPTSAAVAKNKSVGESIVSNGVGTVQPPKSNTPTGSEKGKAAEERLPLTSDYEELLKACREADASPDMEKLVKTKLVKYYYNVHPDFVRSKGFGKSLRTVITNIRREPDLVYLHLKTIVDELKVRSKNKDVATVALMKEEKEVGEEEVKAGVSTSLEKDKEKVKDKDNERGKAQSLVSASSSGPIEDISSSTGNKHTDEQIKKLNKALYILTKRIEVLESAEVDWDDEDSSYLQVERFKKRACQIYEKICDLTGESKNAHRLVKKPIHFNGTTYTQFNKTLQAFINRTREFPDYFDVLRMLEHCNRQYDYALASFEIKRIAHDAFMKVGKLLQSRRKTDLYETVTHFTAHEKDPAAVDAELQAKLSENQKKRTRISDVIEKYAREQDMAREELKEARQAKIAKLSKSEDDEADDDTLDAVASTSAHAAKAAALRKSRYKTENGNTTVGNENDVSLDDDDEDDDDEEEDDDEQVNGSDLDADVEKLANGELSDVESDTEIVSNKQITAEITKVASRIEEEESITQKDPPHKTSTAVAATDSASDSATTKTKVESDNVATNAQPVFMSNAAPTQAKLPVNNNAMRQKTAEPLANDAPKLSTVDISKLTNNATATETTTVANGRAKPVITQSGNNKPQPTTTQATGLKIVSVSSLKNVETMDNKSQSNLVNPQSNQAKTQKPPTELKRQRTVAEIVISDEES